MLLLDRSSMKLTMRTLDLYQCRHRALHRSVKFFNLCIYFLANFSRSESVQSVSILSLQTKLEKQFACNVPCIHALPLIFFPCMQQTTDCDLGSLRADKWVTMWWFLFGVHPYQPTLDFAFFILEWTIVKRIWCYIRKKSFQNDPGRPLSIILPIKSKMAKKLCFFYVFCYSYLHLPSFKVCGFTNDYKFYISVNKY